MFLSIILWIFYWLRCTG